MASMTTPFQLENTNIIAMEPKFKDGIEYNQITCGYTGPLQQVCPKCGGKMYKHGSRKLNITDTPVIGKPAKWTIILPRMRCSQCKEIWQPELSDIDENHKMTKRAYLDIAQRSLKTTFSSVAEDYLLTKMTIRNIFTDFMQEKEGTMHFRTPTFIGIDEIKIKKIGEVTVITDLEHHTLYDMLNGRNQKTLTEYFMNMPDRDKVLWVCSDMYRPFQKTIGDAMPNARWAIDHFHVVMKANEAVDEVRKRVQDSMSKRERIDTKKGLAYTLKMRERDLAPEDASKLRACRKAERYKPMMQAYDLKEEFFEIYDENPTSKENAQKAFAEWEKKVPDDELFHKFKELAGTVHHFYEQIFNYWDCPIAISNGFTECTNRLIRENNLSGRGYSFDVLRARTLYRKANLNALMKSGNLLIGPVIPENGPVFHMDSADGTEGTAFNPETGEILD